MAPPPSILALCPGSPQSAGAETQPGLGTGSGALQVHNRRELFFQTELRTEKDQQIEYLISLWLQKQHDLPKSGFANDWTITLQLQSELTECFILLIHAKNC